MDNNVFHSKYPAIVIDRNPNSALADKMIKKLTVEEYYDLVHHTHSSLDVSDGNLNNDTINGMQTKIESLNQSISDMEDTIKAQNELIETLSTAIEEIKTAVTNSATVSDWDVTKPGIQDIDGNDVDTLGSIDVSDI